MKKIKLILVACFLVFGFAALFIDSGLTPAAHSYSTQPPPQMTGAPGEQNCSLCHDEAAVLGSLAVIAPATYVPGQTYQIQVQHATTDTTRLRWGFEATALDGTNTMAGTFTDTSAFTQQDFGDGRFYIEHNQVGTFAGTPNGVTWTFDWNAPATDVGPVTFYAAGNQANNNDNPSGDQTYLTTTVIQPAGPTPTSTATETNTPTPTETATATATATGTPGESSVSGTVTYGNPASPTTKFISNATVANTVGSPSVTAVTDAPGGTAGQYTLTGFGSGSYSVGVTKTTGQNSISSADAARIAQHVAGTLLMTNDRQKIAADVTNNGALSSTDAAQLARFVTGLGAPIGLTNQWRFFVPDVSQPTFPIGASPTTRSYTDPIGVQTGQDYIGILVGEVTGNWNPTAARTVNSEQWTVDSQGVGPERVIAVELASIASSIGKEIVVPVTVEGIADKGVISYEIDLRYDPSVLQPLVDPVNVAGTASRGLSVVTNATEPGLLRVVLYGAYPIEENGVLFNLRFTSVGDVGSASALSFERIVFNEGEPRASITDGKIELF